MIDPGRMDIKGCCAWTRDASTRAPSGAKGHRVALDHRHTQLVMDGLIGMPINCADNLESHGSKIIGVVLAAYMQGFKLIVEGRLWPVLAPEAVQLIKTKEAGMSFEIGDVRVPDTTQSIWKLESFYFHGVTILKKSHAAYDRTWVEVKEDAR